jgi:hypothetical protein
MKGLYLCETLPNSGLQYNCDSITVYINLILLIIMLSITIRYLYKVILKFYEPRGKNGKDNN